VEAVLFLGMMLLILRLRSDSWSNLFKNVLGKKLTFIFLGGFLIYFWNLSVNLAFYKNLVKSVLKPFLQTSGLGFNLESFSFGYVLNVFLNYALLGFLVLGLVGIFYAFQSKKTNLCVPFLVLSPTFLYLFLPNISADHPWMLRRFLFAVIPACIFYSVWFLEQFFLKKIYFYLVAGILLFSNLAVFVPYLNFVPGKELLSQTQALSSKFQKNDLLLIDREATGDPWSMPTGPMHFLFGKQAVYFFNPQDLLKINLQNFSNIYLIVPEKNISFYQKSVLGDKLELQEKYVLKNNLLVVSQTKEDFLQFKLPEKKEELIHGQVYLFKK
jgi:hypothetical protein